MRATQDPVVPVPPDHPAPHLAVLTVEQLEEGICLRAGRLAAAEAELLLWIAEFDRREGWCGHGMVSCAHWLSWRTGLSAGTARERVRVAHRLEQLPEVSAAFQSGRMSWSQVRAVTRAAEPDDGIDWAGLARHTAGAQMERLARGIRRAKALAADAARDGAELPADEERARSWAHRTRVTYGDDGTVRITLVAPAAYGPLILEGIAAQREALEEQARARAAADVPAGTPEGAGTAATDVPAGTPDVVTDADALLLLARQSMAGAAPSAISLRRRRTTLRLLVDPLSRWARLPDGELLPPGAWEGLVTPVEREEVLGRRADDPALTRHDRGRREREVSHALRQLLGVVDGERCRFSGCTRHRALHAHHVVWWSRGGRTDLANLVNPQDTHSVAAQTQRSVAAADQSCGVTRSTAERHRCGHPNPRLRRAGLRDPFCSHHQEGR